MKRREFITLLGGVAARGARGRTSGCGASASSPPFPPTMLKGTRG
jgi:hypothetical protein